MALSKVAKKDKNGKERPSYRADPGVREERTKEWPLQGVESGLN